MTKGEIAKEIGDINLAYLLLAQKLVKQDRAAAMFRLGLSRELADLLANLSLTDTIKLAASSFMLCSPRLDDASSLTALVGEHKDMSLRQAHMSILVAGRQLDMLEGSA